MLNLASDHIGQVSWELFAAVNTALNFDKISGFFGCRVYYMLSLEGGHIVRVSWESFAAVIVP